MIKCAAQCKRIAHIPKATPCFAPHFDGICKVNVKIAHGNFESFFAPGLTVVVAVFKTKSTKAHVEPLCAGNRAVGFFNFVICVQSVCVKVIKAINSAEVCFKQAGVGALERGIVNSFKLRPGFS